MLTTLQVKNPIPILESLFCVATCVTAVHGQNSKKNYLLHLAMLQHKAMSYRIQRVYHYMS